ncbi:MAG: hypothetical protein ACK5NY_09760 [Burkholderiaceae bacterium]
MNAPAQPRALALLRKIWDRMRRLTRTELAIVLLCILSTAGLIMHAVNLNDQTRRSESTLRHLQTELQTMRSSLSSLDQSIDPRRENRRYQEQFPPEKRLMVLLKDMELIAAETGIALERSSYQYQEKAQGGIIFQHEIVAPIKGTYPGIKLFLLNLLNRYPTLTIKDLTLHRPTVSDPQITADVRWVFHCRKNDDSKP